MKKLIQKYYVGSFYLITLILSLLLLPLHFVFQSAGEYAVSFTQFSPALAVVLISLVLKDRSLLREIKKRFRITRTAVPWILPSIALPCLCIIASSLIMTWFNIGFISWKGDGLFYILSFAAMLLGSAAEEVGWRGFLLPNLQKKYSPFISSIIVGVLWGVWHFNFTGGILGFVLYTVTIIEMSVLMTWVFNRSNGNLTLMTVWHLVFNITSRIFLWERFGLQLFIVESIVFGILCLVIVFAERKTCFLISSAAERSVTKGQGKQLFPRRL